MKGEIKEKIEKGWIHVEMIFDVLAVGKDLSQKALKAHIDKLSKIKGVGVYKKKIEKPVQYKEYNKVFSSIGKIKVVVKDIKTLTHITLYFAPASTVILEPDKFVVKVRDMEGLVNDLAGFVHSMSAGILMSKFKRMQQLKKRK